MRQPEVLAAFPTAFGYPPDENDQPKYSGRPSDWPQEGEEKAS